jgi:uncharacterized membrane protein YgcG
MSIETAEKYTLIKQLLKLEEYERKQIAFILIGSTLGNMATSQAYEILKKESHHV